MAGDPSGILPTSATACLFNSLLIRGQAAQSGATGFVVGIAGENPARFGCIAGGQDRRQPSRLFALSPAQEQDKKESAADEQSYPQCGRPGRRARRGRDSRAAARRWWSRDHKTGRDQPKPESHQGSADRARDDCRQRGAHTSIPGIRTAKEKRRSPATALFGRACAKAGQDTPA